MAEPDLITSEDYDTRRRLRGPFIWLSGADPETLAQAPRDIHKHQGLGGVVLTTAVMAAGSSMFALSMGIRAPWYATIPIGLLWGLAILNLDRWLVTAAQRQERWYQNLVAVLPRLMLALIIGTVISTPLVLRIFQNEINAELEVVHQKRLNQHEQDLQSDTRFSRIPELETEVAKLQALANGTNLPGGDQDAEVTKLQSEYDALVQQYAEARDQAICEYDGTCGTKTKGNGAAFRQRQAAADEIKQRVNDAKRELDEAKAKQQTATGNERATAKQRLPQATADLTRLKELKQQEEDSFRASTRNDTGILARLDALSKLTSRNSTLRTAYLVLLIFITSIEVLPVLTKFLMNCGRASAYDTILRRKEQADIRIAEHAEQLRADARERRAKLDAEQDERIRAELEQHTLHTKRTIHRQRLDDLRRQAAAATNPTVPPQGWRKGRGKRGEPQPEPMFTPFPPPEPEPEPYLEEHDGRSL
ncbi:MAG: DUF4407 domain-containing protein [Micromonosporaceae bacterium]|nr:DUF4407 domain-containing protein [Micromonosporaceae bacterium]